jgi:hypothetical protein
MRNLHLFTSVFFISALCLRGQEQPPSAPAERKGMPPRASAGDYQAHGEAGPVTVAAEFMQHSLPTPDGMLVSEDYVVVEAGLFGAPGTRTTLNPLDFSLRINGKKSPAPSEPYAMVYKSTKDPEWEPPVKVEAKSKTSIGTGGGGGNAGDPPPIVHVPIKTQREWEQKIQKASFPEGDRALPQAGLLFFPYRGKASGIHSLELIYSGPSGKVALALQP